MVVMDDEDAAGVGGCRERHGCEEEELDLLANWRLPRIPV